ATGSTSSRAEEGEVDEHWQCAGPARPAAHPPARHGPRRGPPSSTPTRSATATARSASSEAQATQRGEIQHRVRAGDQLRGDLRGAPLRVVEIGLLPLGRAVQADKRVQGGDAEVAIDGEVVVAGSAALLGERKAG